MRNNRPNRYFVVLLCLTFGALASISLGFIDAGSRGTQNQINGSLKDQAKAKGHHVVNLDDPKWKERHELKALVKNSTLIAIGAAYVGLCQLSSDERHITTEYVVLVDRVLKGIAQKGVQLKISLPGGLVRFADGTIAEVRAPTFRKMARGRTYLLFLSPNTARNGYVVPVGGPQGLFEISRDGLSATQYSGDLTVPPSEPENLGAVLREIEKLVKK